MKSLNTNIIVAALVALTIASISQIVWAQHDPAIGTWKTIDDKTGQAKSLVKIEVVNGELQGTVIQTFPTSGETPITHCTLCSDARKNQPIVGMKIMNGLKQDKAGHWSGGEILDPKEGKIYKVKLNTEDGKKLDVRGYVGIALIGRTQTWLKE